VILPGCHRIAHPASPLHSSMRPSSQANTAPTTQVFFSIPPRCAPTRPLYLTPCILHLTPLHLTPYTLHLTPYTHLVNINNNYPENIYYLDVLVDPVSPQSNIPNIYIYIYCLDVFLDAAAASAAATLDPEMGATIRRQHDAWLASSCAVSSRAALSRSYVYIRI